MTAPQSFVTDKGHWDTMHNVTLEQVVWLRGLGVPGRDVRLPVETVSGHDIRRLTEDYKHDTNQQKMLDLARSDADTLAKLFDEDAAEAAKVPAEAAEAGRKATGARKESRP